MKCRKGFSPGAVLNIKGGRCDVGGGGEVGTVITSFNTVHTTRGDLPLSQQQPLL